MRKYVENVQHSPQQMLRSHSMLMSSGSVHMDLLPICNNADPLSPTAPTKKMGKNSFIH